MYLRVGVTLQYVGGVFTDPSVSFYYTSCHMCVCFKKSLSSQTLSQMIDHWHVFKFHAINFNSYARIMLIHLRNHLLFFCNSCVCVMISDLLYTQH